jgi:hypothetical protein
MTQATDGDMKWIQEAMPDIEITVLKTQDNRYKKQWTGNEDDCLLGCSAV